MGKSRNCYFYISNCRIDGTSSKNGVYESDINLQIGLKLQKHLKQTGTTVILTRSDENGIYELDAKSIREKKISDLNKNIESGEIYQFYGLFAQNYGTIKNLNVHIILEKLKLRQT